jgi:hypothetical protein
LQPCTFVSPQADRQDRNDLGPDIILQLKDVLDRAVITFSP